MDGDSQWLSFSCSCMTFNLRGDVHGAVFTRRNSDPVPGSVDKNSCIEDAKAIEVTSLEASTVGLPVGVIGETRVGGVDSEVLDISPGQVTTARKETTLLKALHTKHDMTRDTFTFLLSVRKWGPPYLRKAKSQQIHVVK